mgnify:CR=1 FL=1
MERRAENNCPTAHKAPEAPYYAVIFSSTLADNAEGYGAMADRMVALARSRAANTTIATAAEPAEPGKTTANDRVDADMAHMDDDVSSMTVARSGPQRSCCSFET